MITESFIKTYCSIQLLRTISELIEMFIALRYGGYTSFLLEVLL